MSYRDWEFDTIDAAVIAAIDAAFEPVAKPEWFTDAAHCDECADHNRSLSAHSREAIRRDDLGCPGWDPITFATAQAMAYLFPAMACFALMPASVLGYYGEYLSQLVRHLARDGNENRLYMWCGFQQRQAVGLLLLHVWEHKAHLLEDSVAQDDMLAALADVGWVTAPTEAPR